MSQANKPPAKSLAKISRTNPSANQRKANPRVQPDWWAQGIRFECQGSGQCCVSHGEYGFVWMNMQDRRRMAAVLGMTTSAFTRKYCILTDGLYRLKDGLGDACIFLKDRRCTVYKGRPTQCRTWPFWPEVMNAKTWKAEVASFCPGVGRGRTISADEIQNALDEQKRAEDELVSGR